MNIEYRKILGAMLLVIGLVACRGREVPLDKGLTYQETAFSFEFIDWAPDSSRLVGSTPDIRQPSLLGLLEKPATSEVYVWDPATDSYLQVSDENPSAYNVNPIWHPKNDQILYYSEGEFGLDGNGSAGVVNEASLSRWAIATLGSQMDWSWNESEIIIANGDKVYPVSLDGKRRHEIWSAAPHRLVVDLAVSPTRHEFAVATLEVGKNTYQLLTVAGEDGSERELYNAETPIDRVQWSPDGQWLVFLHVTEPGKWRPYATRSDAGCLTEPWNFGLDARIRDISWSPDGRNIAVSLVENRNDFGILFADADSRNVRDWLSSGSCSEGG